MSRGTTLVELLVALVLLSVALLGLAAGSATVARSWRVASGEAGIAERGAARMEESLAAVAAGRDAEGDWADEAYAIRWWTETGEAGEAEAGARRLVVSVTYAWGGLRRADTLVALWLRDR